MTFSQFRQCLRDRGVKGSDEKFKLLFHITDQDNDGHVSFEQFVQAVQTIQMHFFYDKKRVSEFMTKNKNEANETRVSVWAYNRKCVRREEKYMTLISHYKTTTTQVHVLKNGHQPSFRKTIRVSSLTRCLNGLLCIGSICITWMI